MFHEGEWLVNGIERVGAQTTPAPHFTGDDDDPPPLADDGSDDDSDDDSDKSGGDDNNNHEDHAQTDESHSNDPVVQEENEDENVQKENEDTNAPAEEVNTPLRRSDRVKYPPAWHADYAHFTAAMTDLSTDDATASAVLQDIIRDHIVFHDDTDEKKPLSAAIRDYAMFSDVRDNPTDGILTPSSYKGAMSSPQKHQWLLAMDAELESHRTNNTWDEQSCQLPRGRKHVGTKWIFKVKRDSKGKLLRYKARLVAKGFSQREGQDFNRTFAPVMQTSLLRTLLSLAAVNDWEIDQIDVKTAFLYGNLDEEIYAKLPDGSIHKLNKAMYGLKQASRQFYSRFNKSLIDFGLDRCDADPCCYVSIKNGTILIVIIHVDDAIIFSNSRSKINALKTSLKSEYEIDDIGKLKYCLGWEIRRDRANHHLTINQQQYILDLLRTYGMENCNRASSPACAQTTYRKSMSPSTNSERELMRDKPYLELLGSLLYLATCTRPDISYAVSELSKYSQDPGKDHWIGLKRILRYLKGTSHYGISFKPSGNDQLSGCVDSNHARCPDTRRSRYGLAFMLNNGPVDWKSKLQTIVALSSMESEYIGACEAARIGMWLRRGLKEIGFSPSGPTSIGIDNKSAKIFAEESMTQNRSKHIDTKYHYVRERVAEGSVELPYIPTHEMPADIFTKPLGPTQFCKLRKALGVVRVAEDRTQ